jgi:hypothetical protein
MIVLLHAMGQIGDLVAAATPQPAPVDDDKVTPGWLGLGILVAMGIAVVFLVRSMQTRLRNIDVDRHARERAARQGTGAAVPLADDSPEPDKN